MKTIEQRIAFAGVGPVELFETYVDSALHAKATGTTVVVDRRAGSEFSAFGGGVRGATLVTVADRLIVQRWRATPWTESDQDSLLALAFSATARGACIELVQWFVPDHAHGIIETGWERKYWTPWRAYFARKPRA